MKFKPFYVIIIVIILGGFFLFNSYNTIQTNDEKVAASWSEVLNQYQRRADLVPNLINTVKGYTAHEQKILIEVTEARAKVGSIHLDANQLTDPAMMEKFQQAQSQLSSALSRLIAVSENYPDLKASSLFSDLMVQLEGTENRIAVARGRYITNIQSYNSYIRRIPGKLIADYFDYLPKAQFSVANEQEISTLPQVSFD